MTTVTLHTPTLGARTPGFFSQISAEWTKLRSTRAFYIQIVLAILLAVGFSALVCLAISSNWGKASASDRADFHPVLTSLFGLALSGIVFSVTGVSLVASEYTSGMIRLTMAVTSSRIRVLLAKAVVIALAIWVVGLVATLGAFFAGQAVLSSHAGVPTASLSDHAAQQGIIAGWLTLPLFPLIGAALGAILRSTAAAITATLALVFAPGIFGGLLPEWWQKHVLAYLPGNASDTLLRSGSGDLMHLAPGVAIAAVLIWLALFFGVASVLITRRDV